MTASPDVSPPSEGPETAASSPASGTDPAPPAAPAVAAPKKWSERLLDYVLPSDASERRIPSGIIGDNRFEPYAYILSLATAAIAAVFIEYFFAQSPIPPGGDPGQWISTSYAFVGMSYPSWVIPGQYPPLAFPLLGSLVRLGGPITGARLYVGVVAVLLGLSIYYWARSILRTWSLAILVEGFVLLNPSFIQLFFFGAYPNLLGFVFLFLCIGFGVRFIRSADPTHAFWFWITLGAAILTHTLVAVVLGFTLVLALIPLLVLRRVPRALVTSLRSQLGIFVAVTGVALYYAITALLAIPHNQYLSTGAFAYVKNGLGAIVTLQLGPALPSNFAIPAQVALELLVLLDAFILIALAVMTIFRLRAFTLSALTCLASILAVTLLAVIGWELSVVTDYVRIGFFLIPPTILTLALIVDSLVGILRQRYRELQRERAPAARSPYHRRWSASWPLPSSIVLLALGAVLLLLMAGTATVGQATIYEANDTAVAHDQGYLAAIQAIQQTGIRGAVLTDPGAVKWTRALLDTNTYGPFIPGHYSFDPDHIQDQELAYFALTSRYAATNNLVAFANAGTSANWSSTTPLFLASYFGLFSPIVEFSPHNMTVGYVDSTGHHTVPITGTPQFVLATNGLASIDEIYNEPGFQLIISETALPAIALGRVTMTVISTGAVAMTSLSVVMSAPPGASASSPAPHIGGSGYRFTWTPAAFSGALETFINFSGSGGQLGAAHVSSPRTLPVTIDTGAGSASSLSLTFVLTTPSAQNLISTLPPIISSTQLWSSWNARFVLLGGIGSLPAQLRGPIPPDLQDYLRSEYGAQLIGIYGIWHVILLP